MAEWICGCPCEEGQWACPTHERRTFTVRNESGAIVGVHQPEGFQIVDWLPVQAVISCDWCPQPAVARLVLRRPGDAQSAHLCLSHGRVALAQVGGIVRSESRLRSLGDAVRSKRKFRRPCWPPGTWAYVCRTRSGLGHWIDKIMKTSTCMDGDDWDFVPSPEDTWAMDYELCD